MNKPLHSDGHLPNITHVEGSHTLYVKYLLATVSVNVASFPHFLQ
jgi:hypothetical protein